MRTNLKREKSQIVDQRGPVERVEEDGLGVVVVFVVLFEKLSPRQSKGYSVVIWIFLKTCKACGRIFTTAWINVPCYVTDISEGMDQFASRDR
jgi:hypothetical protein